MDLCQKYLEGCSPYILQFDYNLEKREITLVCAEDTSNWQPKRLITFTDVISFDEETFEDLIDDSLIDSIMGIHVISEGVYCVNTEKRELVIKAGSEPISSNIANEF